MLQFQFPQNKSVLPSELAGLSRYGRMSRKALDSAFDSVKLSSMRSLRHGLHGMADQINRYHDLVRREYIWALADELIRSGGEIDRFVMPHACHSYTSNSKEYVIPFHYFAAPVYVSKEGVLTRDPHPVYVNLCSDAHPDSSEVDRVEKKLDQLLTAKKEYPVIRAKGRLFRIPLVLAAAPLVIALATDVMLWAFRFGPANVDVFDAALRAAIQSGGVKGALAGIAAKLIPFIRVAIDYTTIDNSPDLELVGPMLMWVFIGALLIAGLFASGFLLDLRSSALSKYYQDKWQQAKEQEATSRANLVQARQFNKTRFREADKYRRSEEYHNAHRAFRQDAEETRAALAQLEAWHRAWFEAVSADWDPSDVAVRMMDASPKD